MKLITSTVNASAVFLGSKKLGLEVFKVLYGTSKNVSWTVIHPDDLLDGRSVYLEWKEFTNNQKVNLQISKSKKQTIEMLDSLSPDIGFVCGWYSIIDPLSISKIPKGLWGIHNSLLPSYRGGSPLVWSIINGDTYVGSSVFRLSDGIDDGDLIAQIRIRNDLSDTVSSLLAKIENELLLVLPDVWVSLIAGKAKVQEQDHLNATFCGQRQEIDGLIDWSKNAVDVHNFIRAQSHPYPFAFTYFMGEQIKILDSEIMSEIYFGKPGQILSRKETSVIVSCGDNTAIAIRELISKSQHYSAPTYLDSTSIRLGA